jgi:hypothetical protein
MGTQVIVQGEDTLPEQKSGRSRRTLLTRVVAPITAAVVVIAALGVGAWAITTTSRAESDYHHQRAVLEAQLKTASEQGYTGMDLVPITNPLRAMDSQSQPWWMPVWPGQYQSLAKQTVQLQAQLRSLEQKLYTQSQASSGQQLAAAKAEIAQAQQANAADTDVQALQQRVDAATTAMGAAHTLKDYRAVLQQAQGITADATALFNQAQQENQAVQAAAQQLIQQTGGNLGAIQQAGNQALASGRNDASVAAYMNKSAPFKGFDDLMRSYGRLEKFAGLIGSGDINQAAQGAAAAQRYGGQIHNDMIAGFPSQVVVINFTQQHLWAYQNGQVVMDNAVTTGIRGVTGYGTDFGPMKVLWKSHPWTMHSPFPKGSPYWYPDTVVQWTTFFTKTGESIHDAYWESDSELGPGSQYDASTRSHGCVHLPFSKAEWMYNWATVGMPVIVFAGDGSPVANQLSLITTDDQGNPDSDS